MSENNQTALVLLFTFKYTCTLNKIKQTWNRNTPSL